MRPGVAKITYFSGVTLANTSGPFCECECVDCGTVVTPPSTTPTNQITYRVPILEDGQTEFIGIIPDGDTLAFLFLEGLAQEPIVQYEVIGHSIQWKGSETLKTTYKLLITLNVNT